jgi:transposase
MRPVIELIQQVGALPLIKSFCDKLRLAPLIDELLPLAPQAVVPNGVIFVALVMNRLTSPRPLYRLVEWGRQWGLACVLGIQPELLTDDRVGRLLDAIAESASKIKAAIFIRAIDVFGLDVSKIHWDLTSLRFEGDYDHQDPAGPTVTYGFDPEEPARYKQLRVANLVVGDGAIPLFHQAYSGNTSDIDTVMDCLPIITQLQKAAAKTICLIGDTKLVSRDSMVTLAKAGIFFICPEAHHTALDQEFLDLDSGKWSSLDYVSERQSQLPQEKHTKFRAQEVPFTLKVKEVEDTAGDSHQDPAKKKPGRPAKVIREYNFRRIFIHSSEEEEAQRTNRARRRQRIEKELTEQVRKFTSPYWRKQPLKKAEQAVDRILDSSAGKLYSTDLKEAPEGGGWILQWKLDSDKLAQAEALDGYYTLATNVPQDQADILQVFRDYKAQAYVEKRFADWKGPLKLRPVFLKSNKRVVGLTLMLSVSLMIFSLIERQARQGVTEKDGKMVGLLPEGRAAKPTGRNILDTLSGFYFATFRMGGLSYRQFSTSTPIQARLLAIFNLEDLLESVPQGP